MPELSSQQSLVLTSFFSQMKPRPRLTVTEWAEKYRYVSPPSAETGPWKNNRTPYLKGIMDAACDPDVHTIVVMTASQIGKSEALNNIMYYHMHQDPCPIMMIQPTLSDADDYSKSRITPTIQASPELLKLFGSDFGKSRNSVNTILSKHFPGGRLVMVGANSPSGLSSKSIRIVLADEIGRYEPTKEGDPIELARQRQATFYNSLLVLTSTPGTKGTCPIEFWYQQSDKRNYYVPCIHCGEEQVLKWKNVHWDKDEKENRHFPETARYVCEHCGVLLSDYDLQRMVAEGKWKTTADFDGVAGFGDFPDLYSPWRTMEQTVRDFIRAKDDTELLKVWVNTKLGEPWEEENESLQSNDLYDRREPYDLMLPAETAFVTAAVDVQDNRLEVLTVAWGKNEVSWQMEHVVFMGSPGVAFAENADQVDLFGKAPAAPGVWNQLEDFLKKKYDHPSGEQIPISVCAIDTGYFTDNVYTYVKPRQRQGIVAIKGSSERGKPIVSPPSTRNKKGVKLYTVGIFALKDVTMARLKIQLPSRPGYVHFPDRFSLEYFEQLTAEKKVIETKRGQRVVKWVKVRSRNEAFDLTNYNTIALRIKCPTREILNARIDRFHESVHAVKHNIPGPLPVRKRRRVINSGVQI